jgi:hypothetical protein
MALNSKQKRELRKAEKKAAAEAATARLVTASPDEANSALSEFAAGKRKQEATKAAAKPAGKKGAAIAAAGMAKLPRLPRKSKDKPEHPCECGCPGMTKSHFCPGHDGRPKGWMLRVDRGVVKLADIPDGERQVVEKRLRERDGDGAIDELIAAEAAAAAAEPEEEEDDEEDDEEEQDENEQDGEEEEEEGKLNTSATING